MKKSLRTLVIINFITIFSATSCFIEFGLPKPTIEILDTPKEPDVSTTPTNPSGDDNISKEEGDDNSEVDKPSKEDEEILSDTFDFSKYEKNENILLPKTFSLNVDSQVKLPCSFQSNNTFDINSITWISGNQDIATVENGGLIKSKKHGETYIYAIVDSQFNRCRLSIYDNNINNISFESDFIELSINESVLLTPSLQVEEDGQKKEISNIKYISSNSNIVEVIENSIKGIKVGEAQITAFYDANNNSIIDENEIQKNLMVGVSNSQLTHSLSHYYYFDEKEELKRRDISLTHFSEYGEVPFININDVVDIRNYESIISQYNISETRKASIEKKDNIYYLYLPTNVQIIIDYENNLITYSNPNSRVIKNNNGIYGDICLDDYQNSPIAGSEKTRILKKGTPHKTINLSDYNLKMYFVENNLYLPFHLVSQVFLITPLQGENDSVLFYNGNDIYSRAAAKKLNLYSYLYSSDNSFLYYNSSNNKYSTFVKDECTDENVKYVYTYYDTTKTKNTYNAGYMKFYNDNTGEFKEVNGVSKNLSEIESKTKVSSYKFIYDEDEINNTISVYKYDPSNPSKLEKPLYIKKEKSFFNSTSFPNGYKEFNYNLLALYFDYFYGMKEFRNINSFYEMFENSSFTIKTGIYTDNQVLHNTSSTFKSFYDKSDNIQDYNVLMTSFVNCFLGFDCHSNPTFESSIGKIQSTLFRSTIQNTYSQRLDKLSSKINTYKKLRKNKLSKDTAGIYSCDSTFIIQFDKFNTLKYPNNNKPSYNDYKDQSFTDLVKKDTFGALSNAFSKLEQKSNIKNVVIDLTCNAGGDSTGLVYTQAFLTKDPTFTYNLGLENILTEFHYKFDLNGDGLYGSDDDTFEGKYNFFLLTSDFSFSCANALASCCKNNGCATIIGKQSGGGPCCLFYTCDAMGFCFYSSHPSTIMVKNYDDYEVNDNGVVVDYELSSDYWYDYPRLSEYLNTKIIPNL